MSTTTCARSGGAVLYTAGHVPPVAGALLDMQADMDSYAKRPETTHRVHQDEINQAWAEHAQQLRAAA